MQGGNALNDSLTTIRFNQLKCLILDQLLPLSCLLCNQPCHHPISLCSICQNLITSAKHKSLVDDNDKPAVSPLWETFRYFAIYGSPIKELLTLGKFQNNLAALKVLGQLFADNLATERINPELSLIPVPLHHNRLLSRGYNQSYEISLPIANSLNLIINNHCIARTAETETQHFLSRLKRHDNTRNIFKVTGKTPKHVAVIDDVFTTGATMRSVCTCLRKAGVETIEVWIIARTPKPSSGILASHSI